MGSATLSVPRLGNSAGCNAWALMVIKSFISLSLHSKLHYYLMLHEQILHAGMVKYMKTLERHTCLHYIQSRIVVIVHA